MSVRSSCCPWCLSLGLCMCYRRLCCHCSVWLDSRLSHVMAGVCFRSAAQKLLEVSVYKQGDVWDHIWIHGQSADSSGVLYCLWVQVCTVSSLLCPLSQYPLFQSFSYRLIFPFRFNSLLSHSQPLPKANLPSLGKSAWSTKLMKHVLFYSNETYDKCMGSTYFPLYGKSGWHPWATVSCEGSTVKI